jgi:hypothetical protein
MRCLVCNFLRFATLLLLNAPDHVQVALQLFMGKTSYPAQHRAILYQVLPTPEAKEAIIKLVQARSKMPTFPRSILEQVCLFSAK